MKKIAIKKRKSEFIGKGCFLQGLGLLCPFIGYQSGPLGLLFGIVLLLILLVVGSRQSFKLTCSNCGTVLLDASIRECPGCHAQFPKAQI